MTQNTIAMPPRIIRKTEVLNTLRISRPTLFNRMNNRLLPQSIPLGGLSVGWLEPEIQSVLKAFVSEYSSKEIKNIVIQLVESHGIDKEFK